MTSASNGETASTPARVVAVDDQRDALRLLQIRLQSAGMECVAFSDGDAALKFVNEQLADVIILDVMMPQLDGFEICRRLKESERTRDIPVIFLTAKMATEDKVRGLEVGGHDYLSKPVDQQELLARTRAALRVKQLQDQLKKQLSLQQTIHQLHQEKLSEHWQTTLGQLAASLAHEINNPLAVALGSVQLLAMSAEQDPDVLDRLHIIDQSLQRAAQKLRSLLLIAQPSRVPEAVLLSKLIEDVVALVNYEAVVHKVKLQTQLDGNCAFVGVPAELARALLFILNNAIEAVSGDPHPQIVIQLERQGALYYLRVADNGTGIPEEIRTRVFERFFTTKGPPHHGIGLYLAAESIASSGGTMEVAKEPFFGATELCIRLPAQTVV